MVRERCTVVRGDLGVFIVVGERRCGFCNEERGCGAAEREGRVRWWGRVQ